MRFRAIVSRIIPCLLIAAFLLLAPRPLRAAWNQPPRLSIFSIRHRETLQTITLYHIASCRTYQGSVTLFLQDMAEAFEKKHRGVHIRVEGMTADAFSERISNGRKADAYSFFSGDIYREQLQPLEHTFDPFLSGLPFDSHAIPYFFSGYVLCRTQKSDRTVSELLSDNLLAADPLHLARLSLCGTPSDVSSLSGGKCEGGILDLRSAGDLIRSQKIPQLTCEPLDTYTDQVCYLGIGADTEAEKVVWLQSFFAYLLSEKPQQKLTVLGAFPASATVDVTYAQTVPAAVYAVFRDGVCAPDPFLWYTHRTQLKSDAAFAVSGDAYASQRFFERWAVVFKR